MNGPKSPSPEARGEPWDLWFLLASALAGLLPYALYHGSFARLYWFGDEFTQIDLIDRFGFWRWTGLFFGENFAPVFKLLWGGGVLAFGGSYAVLIAALWLTHALNVALLGRLMRTCGIAWTGAVCAQVVFGLTPATLETLAWSVQWAAVLSVTFMLLAFDGFFRPPIRTASFACAAGSALCFVRGVLTGPLLACASLWPGANGERESLSRRCGCAAAYLGPPLVVVSMIGVLAEGNQHRLGGHEGEAALYAAWFYCLNPAYSLFSVDSWGWHTVLVLGFTKFALVAWSVARSRGRQRTLFMLLVAFDVGNAILVGLGRYHLGLETSVSSRYQYASLVAVLPLAGFWFSVQWEKVPGPVFARRIALAFILAALGSALCRQWEGSIEPFSTWRGTDSRRLLLRDPDPGPFAVPGYPGFPTERAKALIAKYHLH